MTYISQYGGLKNKSKSKSSNDTDTNTSKKTTIIVVVVIIIIILLAVGGGGYYYFFIFKKKSTPAPIIVAHQYDYLKCETTNATNIPTDCFKKMWIENGCTEPIDLNQTEKQKESFLNFKNEKNEPLTYDEINKIQNRYLMNNYIKQECYGTDKSKWPESACNKYNKDSTNIDDDCITELYLKSCPDFDIKKVREINPDMIEDVKKGPLEQTQAGISAFSSQFCKYLYIPMTPSN
jgi:hypothetical protein